MTEQQMPAKFRITWKDGRYFVDIPNYNGGDVVRADIAERMADELRDVLEWATVEKAPLREQEINSIRSALSDFRSATQDTEARYDDL